MKKDYVQITALGLLFLLFIQLAGTLVESIYLLDLLHSNLDAKVLGVLFFFTPLLLLPFYKKFPRGLVWLTFGLLFLARGILPYLNVANRMLVSGLGTFAVMSLFFLLLRAFPKGEAHQRIGLWGAASLALAISLSVLLRTANHGVEYSLIPAGGWVGWVLVLLLGLSLTQLKLSPAHGTNKMKTGKVTQAVLGIFLVLILSWFSFSAPAVIARWTQGNYTLIVAAVSLFSTGWVLLSLFAPYWPRKITSRLLLAWNLIFTLSLTATILSQQVGYQLTPDSAPVMVGAPGWMQSLPLVLTMLLFPVIFLDMKVFLDQFHENVPAPRDLVPGILIGSFLLILLVFANIFTNVWGYVPLGNFFRGKYWLPFLVIAGLITLLAWLVGHQRSADMPETFGKFHWGWGLGLAVLFAATVVFALPVKHIQVPGGARTSVEVMTFNIQQANDVDGEKSFERQLALIRKVSPDILSLQETDSTRISLNNNDYVRYYADHLGYYSYFGPTTVMGTYGTSLLSKYPLENTRTAYIYSDKDENGIAEADVKVGGITLSLFDVHPDGSPTVDMAFARSLIAQSKDKAYVIAMGDYNLRDYEDAYKLINSVYTNVWTSVYPSKISADGIDMSGDNRIDHIFISHNLTALNPVYILPPASATDHAVHWTELDWSK